MKIIYKEQTEVFKNGNSCYATEYPLGEKDIDNAVIKVTGRYPEKGYVINLECKELAYIISGAGKIVVEDKEASLKDGDLVFIEPGEKFFWDGNFIMLISCAPAWNHDQYKQVE